MKWGEVLCGVTSILVKLALHVIPNQPDDGIHVTHSHILTIDLDPTTSSVSLGAVKLPCPLPINPLFAS